MLSWEGPSGSWRPTQCFCFFCQVGCDPPGYILTSILSSIGIDGSEGCPGLFTGVNNVPTLGLVSRQVVIHRGPTVKAQQCVLCDIFEL